MFGLQSESLLPVRPAWGMLVAVPRTARASVGGVCYHVLNRGNGRSEVFHKAEEYAALLKLLRNGGQSAVSR